MSVTGVASAGQTVPLRAWLEQVGEHGVQVFGEGIGPLPATALLQDLLTVDPEEVERPYAISLDGAVARFVGVAVTGVRSVRYVAGGWPRGAAAERLEPARRTDPALLARLDALVRTTERIATALEEAARRERVGRPARRT